MPKIMINLNANEISRVIDQLSQREKTVLIRKLEKETWAVRFNQLLEKVRLKAKDFPVRTRCPKEITEVIYDDCVTVTDCG